MRAYNGIAPGPSIHVQPGGTLEVELINCLHPPPPPGFTGHEARKHIRLSHTNATNLRMHGPHISGESPKNNIFVTVEPQNSTLYKYKFDTNHQPGTHFYRPHHGVAGMLIVGDPEDYFLPAAVKEMPEIQMVVQNINVPHLRDVANMSKDEVTNYIDHNFERTNAATSSDILMLVNMQFIPVVRMEVNKWYRWRMAMSSIDKTLAFVSESQQCEFKLLAKDGIYLSDAPRVVPVVIISAGNRADIAVRCSKVGREKMDTTSIPLSSDYGGFDPDMQPTFLEVDVVPQVQNLFLPDNSSELEAFNVSTPCYLVDLRGIDECHIATTFKNRFNCEPSPAWSGRQDPLDLPGDGRGDTGDFFPFKDKDTDKDTMTTYMLEFPVGTVQEITMTFAPLYPYHQYVNPFQIQAIQTNDESLIEDFVSIWYQVGDWQDTLLFPHASFPPTNVTMRFQTDKFTGMFEHCYMFDHNKGIMAVLNVYGEEGTYWPEARQINPACIEPTIGDLMQTDRTKSSSDTRSGKSKGRSKSSKCSKSSKSKQSKKGQSSSESSDETANSTLFTSTNVTDADDVGSTSYPTVDSPPLYPTTGTTPAEVSSTSSSAPPITDVPDPDADSASISSEETTSVAAPLIPTTPSIFEPPTPTKESPNTQLPQTPDVIDKEPPVTQLESRPPPSSAVAGLLLSSLSWAGLLVPLLA